jgi:preprotein translocase subunit SecD
VKTLGSWRIISTLVFTVLAIAYVLPNFSLSKNIYWLPNSKINLGLDLRGGSHLLLDVDFDTFIASQLETLTDALRKELRNEKVGYQNLDSNNKSISFILRVASDVDIARKTVRKLERGLIFEHKSNLITLSFSEEKLQELKQKVLDQSIEIIRMRVDPTGTTEPTLGRQGDRHILLQVPGDEDPTRLKSVLGKTAKLTFHLVDENANIEEAAKGHLPPGSMFIKGDDARRGEYGIVVKKKVALSGDLLTDAQATFNQQSQPAVLFSLNSMGGKIFADITRNNTGKRFAIVLDHKLLSDPVINEPIMGGSSIISGNFTVESANELALLLRAGALPAPLHVIEERSIGPNLGADSIEAGKKAGIIGFISVVIFMVWSYGMLGIFANIALTLALLYIFAMLSIFHATLTLPGIAGIILTIGMAVDANVLIYERIGEEIRKGASNLYAVRQGFDAAFATITDSNITTLIVSFLLYMFGVGAVKGFAVTLSIGIVASMFSATVVTKLLVDSWIKYYKPMKIGL